MSSHEQQVLGSMLISKAAIEDAAEIVAGADFADPRHEVIFDAIVHVHHDGKPVDTLSVHDHLAAKGARVDLSHLHELIGVVASPASAGYHAHQVKADSTRRVVRQVGEQITAMTALEDPLDAVNAARERLDSLIEETPTGITHEESVYAAIDSLNEPVGIKTPWADLSQIIQGWAPGMLYIAGARPGAGKTVLGIGALIDAARRTSGSAVMVSLEMPKNELYLRMLSNIGSVDGQRIMNRDALTQADRDALDRAAANVARLPLAVDDRTAMSLAQIRAFVRGQQRKQDVALVVVDYLTLVRPPADAPKNDRRVQVDAIAQGLKNLARDLHVPILALAQLNRGIEGRAEKTPTLADLRESGGIEAAADCVLLLHRLEDSPHDLHVSVAKNRHGPKSHLTLNFVGHYSRIEDIRNTYMGAAS